MTDKTEDVLGTQNLELNKADLYHTGIRVKWDHYKEHFHTGSLIVCAVTLETAELELDGKVGFLEYVGYEVEWGMWRYDYYLMTKEGESIPVDIDTAVFTLKTPVPFSKF